MDTACHLIAADFKDPLFFTPVAAMSDFGLHPAQLRRRGGHHQLFRAQDIGVDPLKLGHADHLIHSAVHRPDHCADRAFGRGLQIPAVVPGKATGQPAAVPARGTEACEFLLDHQDMQRRVGLFQVIGRPQPGITRTDDCHINCRITGQSRTALRQADICIPEGHIADLHGFLP